MFCTRLANGGLFPTGDPIVPFVISPRFECLNKRTHPTHGTCGVLDCLLFCGIMWPNYRISLVGYHCSIEFPCGVPLFYCCKYPTLYTRTHSQSCVRCILRTSYCSPLLFPLLLDLNFFRHLPLDLYTFFNRGHLLTITANRGLIVPLCYKSSVYPLDTLITHTHMI